MNGKLASFLTSGRVAAGAALLLTVLVLQLGLTIVEDSQSWDEGNHLFAGYMQWKSGDVGLNPEHPPLAKLLAAAPLTVMRLWTPAIGNREFKHEAFLDGRDFVARNNPDTVLYPSRAAAALFTVLLALVVFAAAREMYGPAAALGALAVLVFEPNLLAHGAKVTTDAGLACCMLGSVYAFYRFAKAPSLGRLLVTGLAAGLALAVKHTGLLVFQMLALLTLYEVVRARREHRQAREVLKLGGGLLAAGVLAWAVLWATYGFQYRARPAGMSLNPPFEGYVARLNPAETRAITTMARWRLLPESYLYGLIDVRGMSSSFPTYLFGKARRTGVWYYFPVAFSIKSTSAFLLLLAVTAWALLSGELPRGREFVYLALPPILYLVSSVGAGLNIGVRHILPLYAFFPILMGGAVAALAARRGGWGHAFGVLLLAHLLSSARSAPAYMAYANEFWGGPSRVHLLLSDSNVDWGQQLKQVKDYIDRNGVKDCWLAYFAQGVADAGAYGVPCRTLPTAGSMSLGERHNAPATIKGTVFVSASTLSGFQTGPGVLNPYDVFRRVKPAAVIDHGMFVYKGSFDIPLAAVWGHTQRMVELHAAGQLQAALSEAEEAAAVCPDCIQAQASLGDLLIALNRPAEARIAYQKSLGLVEGLEPPYRAEWSVRIERGLKQVEKLTAAGN